MDPIPTRDETPTHLFNPLKNDLVLELFNDENIGTIYLARSLEVSTYPRYLADIVKKHLIDKIINDRGLGYVTPEQRKELLEEIEVNIDDE